MSELDDPRVLFSAERTLLAWNRTSVSLIAFGFLVERSGLLHTEAAPASPTEAMTTLLVGMAFILLGVFAALHSSRQYVIALRSLTPSEYPPGYWAKSGLILNLAVGGLGLALCIGLYLARGM